MKRLLLPVLLSCALSSPAGAQSSDAGPDAPLAERKMLFTSDKALIAPTLQPLAWAARPAFVPAFELFRDSGTPWGRGRSLGALWLYEFPERTRLDGLAFLPGSGIIAAEGQEDSYRHSLVFLDEAGVPKSTEPIAGYFLSMLAGDLGGRPSLVAQDMYHLQVFEPSGAPRWKESVQMESAVLCDLDRDGRGELVGPVVRYKNEVRAVRGDGRTLWSATVPADQVLGVAAADLGGKDGPLVAVFGARRGRATVHLLDGKGAALLDFPDGTAPEMGILGRFADGAPLLATVGSEWQAGHDRLRISRLSAVTRKLDAEADLGPTHVVSMALVDFDGDRAAEVVFGTDNGWVLVYATNGRLLSQRHFFGQIPYLVPEPPGSDGRQKALVGVRGVSSMVYEIGLTESLFAAFAAAAPSSTGAAPPPAPGWSGGNFQALEAFIETGPGGPAVFDADGVLWADDVGEAFLRWLIAERLLPGSGGKDLYAGYEDRVRRDKARGYAYAVTAMAGMPEVEVRRLADQFFSRSFTGRIYAPMADLVARLRASGRPVWIVSASNRWVVSAGAEYLGIEPERVIGIDLKVRDGVLTEKLLRPVPYGSGKVAAIKKAIGRRPVLAVGDSPGDAAMLRYSRGPAVLISHGDRTDPKLLKLARAKGWLVEDWPLLPPLPPEAKP